MLTVLLNSVFYILPLLPTYMLLSSQGLVTYRAQAKRTTDLKLIFVPLIFLLLRVWSAMIDIPVYFTPTKNEEFRETEANAALVFVGVSASQWYCTLELE